MNDCERQQTCTVGSHHRYVEKVTMSVLVMCQIFMASKFSAIVALVVLIVASVATVAHTVEARMDAAIWLTEAPSDHGQAEICPCQALVTCTAAGHGLITSNELYRASRAHRAFRWPRRIDAHGITAGVPTPPPKIV